MQCDVVITIRRVMASLSVVGCLFIVGAVLLWKKYRYLPQRLILALSVAAFLDSIAYLMGDIEHQNSSQCKFQAFWLSWFDWAVSSSCDTRTETLCGTGLWTF